MQSPQPLSIALFKWHLHLKSYGSLMDVEVTYLEYLASGPVLNLQNLLLAAGAYSRPLEGLLIRTAGTGRIKTAEIYS